MNVRCRHCGLDLQTPADSEGKALACPGCGGRFICRLPNAVVLSSAPAGPQAAAGPSTGSTLSLAPAPAVNDLPFLDERARHSPPANGGLAELIRQGQAGESSDQDPLPLNTLEDLARDSGPPPAPEPAWQVVERAWQFPEQLAEQAPAEEVTANSHPWYVIISGVPVAAMSFDQLRRKAIQGTIRPRDKLYYAPKNACVRAIDVPGLFPAAVLTRPSGLKRLFRRNPPAPSPVIPQVPRALPPVGVPPETSATANSDLDALQRALGQDRA